MPGLITQILGFMAEQDALLNPSMSSMYPESFPQSVKFFLKKENEWMSREGGNPSINIQAFNNLEISNESVSIKYNAKWNF